MSLKEFLSDNWVWMVALVIIIALAGVWLWWYGNYGGMRSHQPMTRQQRQEFVNGSAYDPRERQRQYEQDDRDWRNSNPPNHPTARRKP